MATRKQVKAVALPSPEASDSDAGSSSAGSGQEEEEAKGSESSSGSDAGEEEQDDESISGSDSGDEGVAAAPASDDEEGSESSGIDMAEDGLEGQSDMSIDSDDCGWTSADEAMFGTVLGKRTQEPGAARSDDDDSDDSGSCFSDFEGDAAEKDGADVDDADEDEDEDEEEEEEDTAAAADTAANTAANTTGAPRPLGGLTPDDAAASARAAKRAKQDLPSKDEQMQLNNTQSIMRTNLLRLQVDEVIAEVTADAAFGKKKVRTFVEDCTALLKSAGAKVAKGAANVNVKDGTEISPAWVQKHGIAGITLEGANHADTRIFFASPQAVSVVGSSLLGTATAPFLNVDITVAMPDTLFDGAKDLLNHGYFNKRKLYLAALCHVLGGTSAMGDVSVSFFKGDPRKPILLVKPALKGGLTLRVLPILSSTVFRIVQLKLTKNNVRPVSWTEKTVAAKTNAEGDQLQPTPHYNQAILEDIAAQTQSNFLTQTLSMCPVAKQAIILFKIWLTQRSLRFGFDCMDSHSATLFVAYLVQTKRISKQMSAVAAFTLVLKVLTEHDLSNVQFDFTKTGVSSTGGPAGNGNVPMTLLYPVFDRSGGAEKQYEYNCLWRMSTSSVSDMCSEAKISLQLLQQMAGRSDAAFQRVFMNKASFFDRHDLFFHIPFQATCLADSLHRRQKGKEKVAKEEHVHADIASERAAEIDNAVADTVHWEYISSKALALAQAALGNRAATIRVFSSPTSAQNSSSSSSSSAASKSGVFYPCAAASDSWTVTVGIVLKKEHCQRRVEKGPSAEDAPQVAKWKRFWGPNKSQIRRFQDGSIIEAVLWEEHLQKAGYVPRGERIVEEVLRHVFARHLPVCCGINAEHVVSKTTQLEHRSLPAAGITSTSTNPEDADTLSRKAIECLDRLRTALISTLKEQLPLAITSVTGTSAGLRYTSLCPPSPHPMLQDSFVQKYSGKQISLLAAPLAVVAVVEGGGKWPKAAAAIQKLKLAFLLRLAELLSSKMKVRSIPRDDALDILQNGFIFRLRILSDMEVEQRLIPPASRDDDPHMVYPRQVVESNVVYPLYCNAIKALHAQFPTFASSVRLFAAWVHGHHFTGAIPHEALELLVASVYLDSDSGSAPTCPSAGFRKALVRLASFDWDNTPLVVDFTAEMVEADRSHVATNFAVARESRSSPLLYIVSSVDKNTGFVPLAAHKKMDRTTVRMLVTQAKDSAAVYNQWIESGVATSSNSGGDETAVLDRIMKSSHAIDRCNVILQFNEALISSRALKAQVGDAWHETMLRGAPFSRLKVFSNLSKNDTSLDNLIVKEGTTMHPLQEGLVTTLKEAFGDIAVFFWNAQRGTEVGVLWKPAAFLSSKFQILESRNRLAMLSEETSVTVLNATEIAAQMLRIGDGLIQRVKFV